MRTLREKWPVLVAAFAFAVVGSLARASYNPSSGGSAVAIPGYSGCRLSLSSTDPMPLTDQTAKTTLFLLPYVSDQVVLYDGAATWTAVSVGSSGISLTVANFPAGGAVSTLYDIFCYSNAGTATLEALAWTTSTAGASARATALVYQNGALVKTGATTRLYLGTVCLTASTQLEDSGSNRFVWNYANAVQSADTTIYTAADSYTTSSATFAAAGSGNAAFKHSFVTGWLSGQSERCMLQHDLTTAGIASVGLSGTTAHANDIQFGYDGGGASTQLTDLATPVSVVGLNYFQGIVRNWTGTTTWATGAAGSGITRVMAGMTTQVWR